EAQQRLGAAWLRVFVGAEKNCDEIVDGTPELAIAMIPSCTGQGIGAQLLEHVLSTAASVYPAVYLSVRATNPAKRLYDRFGFVVIGELTNRVGSKSFHMKKDFSETLRETDMLPTSITGRTRLLGVLADPVAQARSPGMANTLLHQQGLFGDY